MQLLDRIKRWGKNLMERGTAAAGVAREFKNVFELGGIPAFQQFYEHGIFIWKLIYRGFYRPWHILPAPTVESPGAKREAYRLNAAKAVTSEMAGLIWGEECEVHVSQRGNEGETDPLDEFIQTVLSDNAFREKMQEHIEQGLALGSAAVKVWYEQGDTGGKINLGYAMADQFIPIAWDNAKVTEGVFISRTAKGGYYYTRLEWHRRKGETYVITNELYRAEMQRGANANETQDILGVKWPLSDIYPNLQEETIVPVEDALFSFWRTPIANNLDDNSPLGVSIYGNALETLHALDVCYDSFVSEFRLGKKRIIVPARAVRAVVDPATGALRRYFDPNDEVYEAMASDDPGDLQITDNSVVLRVEEHVAAINAFLNVLCLQLGFSANTFTFDAHAGMMTATQVVSMNSKTYKTIRTVQNQLKPMIERLIQGIIEVAALYDVQWAGHSVRDLAAGGYDVNIMFDDSIMQDRQTNIQEGVTLVGAGLLSKYTFLTDPKYGQGLTPEEAEAELKRIREDGSNVDALSLFGGGE